MREVLFGLRSRLRPRARGQILDASESSKIVSTTLVPLHEEGWNIERGEMKPGSW